MKTYHHPELRALLKRKNACPEESRLALEAASRFKTIAEGVEKCRRKRIAYWRSWLIYRAAGDATFHKWEREHDRIWGPPTPQHVDGMARSRALELSVVLKIAKRLDAKEAKRRKGSRK